MRIIFFIISSTSFLFGQDDVQNLFYCNESSAIRNLWIFNEDWALGVRLKSDKKWQVKDIILLNKNRLIVDSLSFNSLFNLSEDSYLDIFDIVKLEDDLFLVMHGAGGSEISIENDRIKLINKQLVITAGLPYSYAEIKTEAVLFAKDWIIGYQRKKINKHASSKNDRDNFPFYWVLRNKEDSKKIMINTDAKRVKEDLFFEDDLEVIRDRTKYFRKYIHITRENIFFNSPRSNECYVFSTKNESISVIKWPDCKKGESYFLYVDADLKSLFVVKKEDKNLYRIYKVSDDWTNIQLVGSTNVLPKGFVWGKIYYTSDVKENQNKLICHYLRPFNQEKDENKILLEEIKIVGHRH